ncbi:KTSC domain-containing protein [Devosia sp. ZB163]|uniref:KTSC domain-containing protein n=1 Tax=Devosia sp. ZB163 TaxID=3025938 RepID=UPI002360221C|nr:KTSC domain-containing protein [Devosia sp. ZB163]MDC9823813.1 KTSC domain-containing protein [Devosia sp. ZB163]
MPTTTIADMAYDPDTQTLAVWFRPSGRRSDHFEVPAAVYDALRQSPAKGRYFGAHVHDGYDFIQSDRGDQPHFSDRSQNIAHHRHAGTEGAKKDANH